MDTEHVGGSRRRRAARHRFTWLRLSVLALVQVALVVLSFPPATAIAVSNTFYLRGDGVPTASLSLNAPSASALPNYDPGRDAFPGLLLEQTDSGLNETDPIKYQLWVGSATGVELDGSASLNFWSAMEDFREDKDAVVQAYLLDCTSSGTSCILIASGSKTLDPWSGGSTSWVARAISFGAVTYTVPVGRSLAVKVVVRKDSGDDMWFAYDTVSYPSNLIVQLATPATTTTSTTTTVPPTTTTTTVPPTTTTTTRPDATTTTTSPPAISENPPPSVQPGGNDDVALAPLPDAGEVATSSTPGVSRTLIDGLELVIPPSVAVAVVSPLLLLEAFVAAFADGGQALLLPGLLLLVGAVLVANESRLLALLGSLRRRRSPGSER